MNSTLLCRIDITEKFHLPEVLTKILNVHRAIYDSKTKLPYEAEPYPFHHVVHAGLGRCGSDLLDITMYGLPDERYCVMVDAIDLILQDEGNHISVVYDLV